MNIYRARVPIHLTFKEFDMKTIASMFAMAMLSLSSLQAFAQDCGGRPCAVPEPGSLTLLVIGGVAAAAAVGWSRRNKRK